MKGSLNFTIGAILFFSQLLLSIMGCAEADFGENQSSEEASRADSSEPIAMDDTSTDSSGTPINENQFLDTASSSDTSVENGTDSLNLTDTDVDTDTDTDADTDADSDTDADVETDNTAETDDDDEKNTSSSDTETDSATEKDSEIKTEECAKRACNNNDNCCPTSCTKANDNDCSPFFTYKASNFDPDDLNPNAAPPTVSLNCNAVFNSSGTPSFKEWCGQPNPLVKVIDSTDGPSAVILTFVDFSVESAGSLKLVGDRAVIFAVFGDAKIEGVIDASAQKTTPGAGGNVSCTIGMAVGNGRGRDGISMGEYLCGSGGGGGAFGTGGADGGHCTYAGYYGGPGGHLRGNPELTPLWGGCPGGAGGGGKTGKCVNEGAAGGGALQISSAGALTVKGTIRANGGTGNDACKDGEGGAGGGSGGAILLEGAPVDEKDGKLEVYGGNGGVGSGGNSGGAGSKKENAQGVKGTDHRSYALGGCGGGGGGYGRVRVNSH